MQAVIAGIAHLLGVNVDDDGSPRYVAVRNSGTPVAALVQVFNVPFHAFCVASSQFNKYGIVAKEGKDAFKTKTAHISG